MNPLLRLIIDFVVLLFVAVLVLVFYTVGVPYRRGFHCEDKSIIYPYIGRGTVPVWALFLCGVVFNLFTIVAVECARWRCYRSLEGTIKPISGPSICGRVVHPVLPRIYRFFGVFLLGAIITVFLTDIGKYSIGRLRPHFMAVCRPDMSAVNCSSNNYITDYTCVGEDKKAIREARLSFPSGHSSFAFFAMVYLVVYIQREGSVILRRYCASGVVLFQVTLVSLAWFTALSRVSDYKHHPTDVLGGSLLGIVVAAAMYVYVDSYRPREESGSECGAGAMPKNDMELAV